MYAYLEFHFCWRNRSDNPLNCYASSHLKSLLDGLDAWQTAFFQKQIKIIENRSRICYNLVTVQTGLRVYRTGRMKKQRLWHPAHREAVINGWMRNSSMGYLNGYIIFFNQIKTAQEQPGGEAV